MDKELGLQWLRRHIASTGGNSPFLRDLTISIIEAGEAIKSLDRTAKIKAGDGHRSIVTIADGISNEHILSSLGRYPDAKFLCEEDSGDGRTLSKDSPRGILETALGAVIDSLDGTSVFARNDPDWCVAAGGLYHGEILSSVITAPHANNGTICYSDVTNGVFVSEGFSLPRKVGQLSKKSLKDTTILRGVDTELYQNILSVMPKIATSVRAVDMKGSGLFALMSIILGRASAVIQTPQKAWDWVPAYHALTNVGGVFHFFRLREGEVVPVTTIDFDAFTYKKENRLGFVAGDPWMADLLFEMLPKHHWERYDPDKALGHSLI